MKERKDLSGYLFFDFVLYFKNTLFNTNCYNLNNYKKTKSKDSVFLKLDTILLKSNKLHHTTNNPIIRFVDSSNYFSRVLAGFDVTPNFLNA